MTVQTQVFVPPHYDIFAGLDVDKKSRAVSFTDHEQLKQALRLPYSAEVLLSYVRKQFPGQRVAFAYEAGRPASASTMSWWLNGFPCLVVAPALVPETLGESARRATAQHSRARVLLSRAAPSSAVARHARQTIDSHQMPHQSAAAL